MRSVRGSAGLKTGQEGGWLGAAADVVGFVVVVEAAAGFEALEDVDFRPLTLGMVGSHESVVGG